MTNKSQFDRELQTRLNVNPEQVDKDTDIPMNQNKLKRDHAVRILRYHVHHAEGKSSWCLVMPMGERSLHDIIAAERVGHDFNKIHAIVFVIAKALGHLHFNGVVHGDFKPRNTVRIHGDMKLIDFDAAVEIGGNLTEKCSSAYIPPELARTRFTPTEDKDEVDKHIQALEKELVRPRDSGCKRSSIFLDFESKLEALKPKSSGAQTSMDIWAFGVGMYYFCTGAPLFNCDTDDNLVDRSEQLRLVNWKGLSTEELNRTLPSCRSFKAFLKKCLSPKPEDRYQSMEEILRDPVFKMSDLDKIYMLKLLNMQERRHSELIDGLDRKRKR